MSSSDDSSIRSGEEIQSLTPVVIAPSLSHRIYSLIGFAWPAFGFFFLLLLCSGEWFALPFSIVWLFPVVVSAALLVGHLLALVLESSLITRWLHFFRGGMPLFFYRHFAIWQKSDPASSSQISGAPAIVFGAKRVMLGVVDELYLTFLGILEIRSYAASGKVFRAGQMVASNTADRLARVPLGALSLAEQKRLVEILKTGRPDLVVNKRLDERLQSPIVRGQAMISAMGAVILLYALFDVAYATFTWLEMLKDYYGSQMCMLHPDKARAFTQSEIPDKATATSLYDRAETLRAHPSPFSWAYRALFANGNSAAQLMAIRAETLFRLGRKEEAIDVLNQALALKPTGYKVQLQLARWLAETGKNTQASEILDKVLQKHKGLLLPRVYNLALQLKEPEQARDLYKRYLSELDQDVFGEEPSWPPGGEKPLMEMWRRDDLEFLAPYLLPQGKK